MEKILAEVRENLCVAQRNGLVPLSWIPRVAPSSLEELGCYLSEMEAQLPFSLSILLVPLGLQLELFEFVGELSPSKLKEFKKGYGEEGILLPRKPE